MERSMGERGRSGFQVIGRSPMPRSIDELLLDALQLPAEERGRIARSLLASLQDEPAGGATSNEEGLTGAARMTFLIQTEQETDGRWLGEIEELPGVLSYGETPAVTMARVQALALRVLADRLDHGESPPELLNVAFRPA